MHGNVDEWCRDLWEGDGYDNNRVIIAYMPKIRNF